MRRQTEADKVEPSLIVEDYENVQEELKSLRREKEYFASVIRNFRNGLLTTDNALKVVHFNRTVERLLGYTPEELRRMKLHQLIQTREEVVLNILREGGRCVDPKTGEMGEFSFIAKDGSVFPVEACFSVINDLDGTICGMTCTFRDVTQKKKMEKALARMDRLASLGELASGMAHEIKNPLACIAGVLQNMQFSDGQAPDALLVPEILSQVEKIDTIINGLLHFAKPGLAEMVPLRLRDIINAALSLVAHILHEKRIKVDLEYPGSDPWVKGDEQLLKQVFLNIITNACDALATVQRERCLKVRVMLPENFNPEAAPKEAGEYEIVEIEIEDNGDGIEPPFLDSIFNPFFTTKYKGTGLGLATSHRIMEEHDGTITVSSLSSFGTTFKLSMPVYHA
ncbi:MAG: PAS domain S-box protein [Deltaproteobacteria bacterium]|nr:PAS domain S-box protein [Deltaproteobacteria bacterium]